MKTALFVCYGGGHADALIPVMKVLQRSKKIQVKAIGVNLAADKIRLAGVPCVSLSNYLDLEAVEIGYKYAKDRHNFNSKVSFADSIAYYGFTMGDLIKEIGQDGADEVLKIFDRRTMFPVRTMLRILLLEQPDVVITTTMNRFEAATLYAANKLGIPSVKVEDLVGKINKTFPDKIQVDTQNEKDILISKGFKEENIILKSELNNSLAMKYCNAIYDLQCKIRPTASCVTSDYVKQNLIKRGLSENSIFVTGQPAFDMHPKFINFADKNEVCKKLGLNKDNLLYVFMSQPTADREDVFRTLIKAFKKLDDNSIQLVVKLHPNEDGRMQRLILEELDCQSVKIVKEIDVRELMAVADLIITVSSTTGIEAAVMNKPLLYINISNEEDDIPFEEMGIGIKCTNADGILCEIKRFKNNPTVSTNAKIYHTDGCAAQRVAKVIEKLAYKNYKADRKVAIIIQARMGSTRLPGKVLKEYCGKPQIQHVIDRMKCCKLANVVLVATSINENNVPLVKYLKEHKIRYFQGDENNVLDRYVKAAKSVNASIIVRVTADNPLTSAVCIDKMIESHIALNADYTTMEDLPLGVTAEVVNLNVLEDLIKSKSLSVADCEHVTLYICQHRNEFKFNVVPTPNALKSPSLRLTVDTAEDMALMQKIYNALYDGKYIKLENVIKYLTTND